MAQGHLFQISIAKVNNSNGKKQKYEKKNLIRENVVEVEGRAMECCQK